MAVDSYCVFRQNAKWILEAAIAYKVYMWFDVNSPKVAWIDGKTRQRELKMFNLSETSSHLLGLYELPHKCTETRGKRTESEGKWQKVEFLIIFLDLGSVLCMSSKLFLNLDRVLMSNAIHCCMFKSRMTQGCTTMAGHTKVTFYKATNWPWRAQLHH